MKLTKLILGLATAALIPSAGFSASGDKAPSKEDRAKMAEMHEKAAACLKSDKSIEDCHKEMHAQCESSGMECPMGRGKHAHKKK